VHAEGRHSIPHSGIVCILDREKRDGLVPDALLRRPTELDAVYKDYLHDVKIIHIAPSTYSDAMVKEKASPEAQTRGRTR